ncbi:MAG TPA: hypothetical protein VFU69_04205 [Ktedonobacterales bacterium]|nr:hypothetical protein [Ktedonobacterales bacterium]
MEWTIQEENDDEFDLDVSFTEEVEEASPSKPEFLSCSRFSCAGETTCTDHFTCTC